MLLPVITSFRKSAAIASMSFITLVAVVGCGDKDDPVDTVPSTACTTQAGAATTYTTDVEPIISASCISCHGTTASSTGAGLDLRTCSNLAENADASLDAIDGVTSPRMPFGGTPLPTEQRNKIAAWIDAGMPL